MSETLLDEIRATKPVAPPDLRERVRALAAQEPARAPFLARFEWRRPEWKRLGDLTLLLARRLAGLDPHTNPVADARGVSRPHR